eukprot:872443_1
MPLHSQIDSSIIHQGYLCKKGIYNTAWKRRFFVLYDDRTIDYFKDKSHSTQRNKAKGTIHLTQIQRVKFVPTKYNNTTKALSYHNSCDTAISASPIISCFDRASLSLSKQNWSSSGSDCCLSETELTTSQT